MLRQTKLCTTKRIDEWDIQTWEYTCKGEQDNHTTRKVTMLKQTRKYNQHVNITNEYNDQTRIIKKKGNHVAHSHTKQIHTNISKLRHM